MPIDAITAVMYNCDLCVHVQIERYAVCLRDEYRSDGLVKGGAIHVDGCAKWEDEGGCFL